MLDGVTASTVAKRLERRLFAHMNRAEVLRLRAGRSAAAAAGGGSSPASSSGSCGGWSSGGGSGGSGGGGAGAAVVSLPRVKSETGMHPHPPSHPPTRPYIQPLFQAPVQPHPRIEVPLAAAPEAARYVTHQMASFSGMACAARPKRRTPSKIAQDEIRAAAADDRLTKRSRTKYLGEGAAAGSKLKVMGGAATKSLMLGELGPMVFAVEVNSNGRPGERMRMYDVSCWPPPCACEAFGLCLPCWRCL